MTAHILKNLGVAIVEKNEQLFLFKNSMLDENAPVSDYELSQLTILKSEMVTVVVDNMEELQKIVNDEYATFSTMDSILELMDKKLSVDYKENILNILAETPNLQVYLDGIIFDRLRATELPDDFSVNDAYLLCSRADAQTIFYFFEKLKTAIDTPRPPAWDPKIKGNIYKQYQQI